ncbi:MAG TPA: S46 family peptidase [Vicinamibacteria bacterium]|nr:S46 family peptidase [Vicinamibacteria bacterium]
MARTPATALLISALAAAPLVADEGMWTYDNPPLARLKEKYGFEPTKEWLDRVRLASVRFMDGGSGSFVSPDGLMITNHHVGLGCIQNLSSAENDYVKNGYSAPTRGEEPACPGYEVNVLVSTEDATAKVLGAVKPQMSDRDAREARKAAITRIENECNAATGLRCNVVTLYQGGEFQLYRYKKYTDVRLVFAPEQQIAFFGGDPDNFTFPRHDVDICLMRAYENGQPAKPAAHLPFSSAGVADGELVFVSGNPGSTSRLDTVAQLEGQREVYLPLTLELLKRRLGALREYSARGAEQERRAKAQIFGLENGLKAQEGRLLALLDAKATARKVEEEKTLRARVAADPALVTSTGDPWATIEDAEKKAAARAIESFLVGFGGSRLLGIAGNVVRYVAEVKKPNEQRLEEYIDSNLEPLKNRLYSKAPIYDDLEEVTLTSQLSWALEKLGPAHPFVKTVLEGRAPADVAKAALAGTKLKDPEARRALVEGGPAAVEASADAMIALARRIDPLARAVRKFQEDEVEAPITRAGEKIAQARWKAYGRTMPPDATFTLRLSYGAVKGFPAEGTTVAPFTTFYGMYDRSLSHGGKAPWDLPPRWLEKKAALKLETPLDFVSTNDIIGGNSGSPVVSARGEFVGIVFDSNIHGLAWDYFFTDERARCVSVDARGILEALRSVYGADSLVRELTAR